MSEQHDRAERASRRIPVGLSTASVWPQPTSVGFEMAAELGFDGVEVMVWADQASQNVGRLGAFAKRYRVPVLSVHAPCLLITQRVWSPDPEVRLRRSVDAALELGANTVVVHPPFIWQLTYSARFADLVAELEDTSGVAIAVENMFKVRPLGAANAVLGRGNPVMLSAFSPSIDPTDVGYRHYTLDLSHSSAANTDTLAMARRMGAGLTHVHLADGTGEPRDEHLVPGRGTQPCDQLCELLATQGFSGQVVLEVNTRKARSRAARAKDLAEGLLFARLHLGG